MAGELGNAGGGRVPWPGDLGRGQDIIVMSRYPHMLDLDTRVWSQILSEFHQVPGRAYYDVKVGSPIAIAADASPADRRLAEGTGCRRIDVVLDLDGFLWVVEVKPLGDHVALGQALTYVHLFEEKYITTKPVIPVVACAAVDDDMRKMFDLYSVRLVVCRHSPF